MKTACIISLITICISGSAQVKSQVGRVNQNSTIGNAGTTINSAGTQGRDNSQRPRSDQTVTDRYLNGSTTNGQRAAISNTSSPSTNSNPFVSGVHASDNGMKRFDSTTVNRNNVNNQTANTTIAGGNDTTFNVNTLSQGGVTTNSGAEDRSGQAQFGQTNWGNSRSTVGESQWTVPPPITASFNKDFPQSDSATWTRNNVDTTIYSAKYKSAAKWGVTNYNSSGGRLDMRTEVPLIQPPRPVSVYIAKQPAGFRAATIYKIQVQGRPDIYEVETMTGKKIYINNDGMEVKY
jgi:hypothetical protein